MTSFLRYKCRIQWYVELAREPPTDCHSLQLFPFFLTSYSQKCPSMLHRLVNPDTFPFREKQLKAPRAHLRFLRSDPSRSDELLGSGRGCSSLLEIFHLKWLKKIQFLSTRRGLGMNDAALCLCPCRLCGPQVRMLWKGELRWHYLSVIGLRCIRISAAMQRTE